MIQAPVGSGVLLKGTKNAASNHKNLFFDNDTDDNNDNLDDVKWTMYERTS